MSVCTGDKSKVKISQNFVAFSEYTNKKSRNVYLLQGLYCISTNNKGTSIENVYVQSIFNWKRKCLSILLFHLIWMRIVEMLLQFMLRIILSTNHADSTKKIQMLSRKVYLLMINFEMKLQIILFLSMAEKSAQVTLDTHQWPIIRQKYIFRFCQKRAKTVI